MIAQKIALSTMWFLSHNRTAATLPNTLESTGHIHPVPTKPTTLWSKLRYVISQPKAEKSLWWWSESRVRWQPVFVVKQPWNMFINLQKPQKWNLLQYIGRILFWHPKNAIICWMLPNRGIIFVPEVANRKFIDSQTTRDDKKCCKHTPARF